MKKKKQQMLGNLEIAAFCDQLSMIVSAGIPIYEGISILQEDAPEEDTAEILSVISNSLDHGSSFCDALRETNVFPKYVLDMIGIGELAGKLEEVLNALTGYYKREERVLDETFFKGVYKLKPGHYLVYKDGKIDVKRYFQPKFEPEKAGLQDTIKKIEDVMLDSVKTHKISDVEVGSFLSSGVDSSFVAATFKGDKTFTVGFDYEKYNEIGYAEKLSEKVDIDNYSKIISTDEYWDSLGKIQYHMDEPLADPSAVALYFVSKLASKHVKVALSGEGADEFFGGYNIYREPMDLHFIVL